MPANLLRNLPGVDTLLNQEESAPLLESYGRGLVVDAFRVVLQGIREQVLAGAEQIPEHGAVVDAARLLLVSWVTPSLRRVINATGVIVHTNLGRAPLPDEALAAVQSVGGGYSTLEFDLAQGVRGKRSLHAETLIRRVTGAEAAFVVNNNAAAVLLALTVLAGRTPDHPEGRGVIVSRGQLVEIGGGFRMPDVMAQSGARMIEVGTTNRTHLRDYEQALQGDAALILRAHHSNYAIIGFTTEPSIDELTALGHEYGVLVMDDVGSGALIDTTPYGLASEPMVTASLEAGADVVMFSGDKLLGGPQAGILIGRADVIGEIRRHPLARAVRPDKMCLAALSATLLHYIKGEALDRVPVWQMISAPLEIIEKKSEHWVDTLNQSGLDCEVIDGQSVVGGGSLPGETLPTKLVAIRVESPERAAQHLRACTPPVIVRREDAYLLIDPRTVLPRDEDGLLAALKTLAE